MISSIVIQMYLWTSCVCMQAQVYSLEVLVWKHWCKESLATGGVAPTRSHDSTVMYFQ